MVIWSESLDRIIPLCQEFEERLIKLLWRTRPLLSTPAASLNNCHWAVGGGSSTGHGNGNGNGSLSGYLASASVEALALSGVGPIGGNDNSDGNGTPRRRNRSSSLADNLFHPSASPSISKGPFGEQGREFDDLEIEEKEKEQPASRLSAGHLNRHSHHQKSEDAGRNDKSRGEYRRTWYGKKVLVPPSSEQGGDLERYEGERRPVRLYAPVYNGLAAGAALGTLLIRLLSGKALTFCFFCLTVFIGNGIRQ